MEISEPALAPLDESQIDDLAASLAYTASKNIVAFKVLTALPAATGFSPSTIVNFYRYIKSGKYGRKSFGSAPKKFLKAWLTANDTKLDGLGSYAIEIITATHVKPTDTINEFIKINGKKPVDTIAVAKT